MKSQAVLTALHYNRKENVKIIDRARIFMRYADNNFIVT